MITPAPSKGVTDADPASQLAAPGAGGPALAALEAPPTRAPPSLPSLTASPFAPAAAPPLRAAARRGALATALAAPPAAAPCRLRAGGVSDFGEAAPAR